MPSFRTLILTLCTLALLSVPALAEEPANQPEAPIAQPATAGTCPAPTFAALGDPIAPACSVQLECSNGTIKSCSGNNSCSTSGPNNSCVTCDGQQQGCCTGGTCCGDCADALAACETANCHGEPYFPQGCNLCETTYQNCLAGCTGGCS